MKSWSTSLDFATINIVYGVNGSGKSSLASLFQEFPEDPVTTGPVILEILDSSGNSATISEIDDYFWPNVRVFNRAYVSRNIHFDSPGGTDATPLLTLGERQIEADARREEIKNRLDAIAAGQEPLKQLIKTNENSRSQLYTRIARQIGEELQNVNSRFNIRSYQSPKVEALLRDRVALGAAASVDAEADLKLVGLPTMERISDVIPGCADLSSQVEPLKALLQTVVVSVVVPELAANSELARWVQLGTHLHEGLTTCQFCASEYSADRRHQLGLHFDESLLKLQGDLSTYRESIASSIQEAEAIFKALPAVNLFYETHRNEYSLAVTEFTKNIEKYILFAQVLDTAAADKGAHPFTELELADLPSESIVSLDGIIGVIRNHNNQVDDLKQIREAAADRLESYRATSIAGDIDTYSTAITTAQAQLDVLNDERDHLIEERAQLPTSELNPQPLADSLNRDLANLIGREELTFTVENGRYAILRSGNPAKHLSEGEQNAISLLYFISSLHAHGVDPTRLIVIIDDPVSSLDSNVLVGASSHLWGRLVDTEACKQLFVFTHNFDLFRMWSHQIERRRAPASRARPASLFEIRMRAVSDLGGDSRRVPVLAAWPTDPKLHKRIRSEYHYLFWRLADTLIECRTSPSVQRDMDAAAVLPNVARRVLEGFLAFKYPDLIDNFEGSVTRANESADPITQQRIVRFLHQFSHNGEGDTGRAIPRPEAVTILTAVFDLMKALDPSHLTAMCAALDIDEVQITRHSISNGDPTV